MKFNQIFEYIPYPSISYVKQILLQSNVEIKLVSPRKTKHGDFRKYKNGLCLITLNKTENQYRFLITLIHELAHYVVFKSNIKLMKPHGNEWKETFRKLMLPILNNKVFPDKLLVNLTGYLTNPMASSDGNVGLAIELKKYDLKKDKKVFLKDIPINSYFNYGSNRIFKKNNKLRKRYLCQDIISGRKFLFSPIAEVKKHYDKSCS